jgi:hypothetical protein
MVWIDSAPALDPARAGSLCRRHADALSVPKGWSIDDRRQPVPMLFTAKDITPAQGSERGAQERTRDSRPAKKPRPQAALLKETPLFDVEPSNDPAPLVEELTPQIEEELTPEPILEQVSEPELEETRAIPWTPRLTGTGGSDDTANITKGRLLGRAFGERRQRTADE